MERPAALSRRPPPVALLALAHAAGALPIHLGASAPAAPLLALAALAPIPLWRRPRAGLALLAAALAGALGALAHVRADARDCRRLLRDGAALELRGRLPGPAVGGRGFLRIEDRSAAGCREEVVVVFARGGALAPAGPLVAVRGRWRTTPGASSAAYAGALRVERWHTEPERRLPTGAAVRGSAATRLHEAFGARGPLAAALVLSRTEGMDAELRDAFARSGTAHLLSISGFHVAVVAALLVALLRLGGARAVVADVAALAGVWGYVLLIGAPDAAARSALLFTLVAVARAIGRPLAAEGTLAAGYLALALLDPGAPGRPGFQLSFAGAFGLASFAPGLDDAMRRRVPRLPRPARNALATGMGATLASLPIVAWHFERVSLMGIPGTIVAGPLVALAIPGLLLVLLLDPLFGPLSDVLAGGTDWVLAALAAVVDVCARPAWASVAFPRGWVLAGCAGATVALLVQAGALGVGRAVRRAVLAAGAVAAIVLAPLARAVGDRGTVAVHVLDVGQGDAVLVRTPGSRWLLIDAGPRSEDFDAGARRVLPELRRLGVRRLELLVLTHPHLDHVGGAPAVLRAVRVGRVLDPGQAQGNEALLAALDAAAARSVPWSITTSGVVLRLDGVELEVLNPSGPTAAPDVDPNDVSVVLSLRYGAFSALLDGDAPGPVEERVAERVGPVDVLKVAHHGSATSSSSAFLGRVRPALALISVGRDNRFGHPNAAVVDRLEAVGARVLRTDRSGAVRVRARADGSWTVDPERPD